MSPKQVLRLIEASANASSQSPATVGRHAAGSGDFYTRLKQGHDLTTRRAARVTQYFSDHWPTNTPWPSDIPRPAPVPGSPAALAAAELPPEDAA